MTQRDLPFGKELGGRDAAHRNRRRDAVQTAKVARRKAVAPRGCSGPPRPLTGGLGARFRGRNGPEQPLGAIPGISIDEFTALSPI